MKKITVRTEKRCWFRHKWTKGYKFGGYHYYECEKCGARDLYIMTGVPKQPIRFKWLSGETNTIKRSPIRKESDV